MAAKKRVPGPGSYNFDPWPTRPQRPQSAVNRPSERQHFKDQPRSSLKDVVPGPGQYYRDESEMGKKRGISMGHRTTSGSFMQASGRVPGPGQYDPTASQLGRKRTLGGTMGTRTGSSFIREGNNRVGPGQYEVKNSVEIRGFGRLKDKGFGSSGHIQEKKRSNKDRVPGPGHYCPNFFF